MWRFGATMFLAFDVLVLVVAAIVGIAAGSLIALAVSPQIEPLLFKQSARDPVVLGYVAGVRFLAVVAACIGRARRAAKADPNTAFRSD